LELGGLLSFYLLYLIDTQQYYSKFKFESMFHAPNFVHISFNIFISQKNIFVGAKCLEKVFLTLTCKYNYIYITYIT